MVCIVIKNIINRLSIVCCVQAKKGEEDDGERGKSAANNKTCLTLIAVGNTIQTTIIFHLEDICLRFDTMCVLTRLFHAFRTRRELSFWPSTIFAVPLEINKHLEYNFWHSYGITHSINLHTELQRRKLIYWWWTHNTNISDDLAISNETNDATAK